MNKECRDKLNKIKEQSYKLFLHNLLDKEERADVKARRVELKYWKLLGWKTFDNVKISDMLKI